MSNNVRELVADFLARRAEVKNRAPKEPSNVAVEARPVQMTKEQWEALDTNGDGLLTSKDRAKADADALLSHLSAAGYVILSKAALEAITQQSSGRESDNKYEWGFDDALERVGSDIADLIRNSMEAKS